jgi:primosomal protein N' (replication factor Y) (superfamily II helicase)
VGKFILVVIRNATRKFDKLYTYRVPSVLQDAIVLGGRVQVPFGKGNKPTEAFVFKVLNEQIENTAVLKDVQEVIDKTPLIDEELLTLVEFIKQSTICTYYDALRIMLPVFSKSSKEKKVKGVRLIKDPQEVVEDIESNRFQHIQQIRVLEILLDVPFISVTDIMMFAGVSRSVLNTLQKHGIIDFLEIEVLRDPLANIKVPRDQPKEPTPEQKVALEECFQMIEEGTFQEVLIHGVTGSGKTEIYLQLIERVMKMGKEAILLVPEISLTPQMVSRFKARFGDLIAVLHSRLSPGERFDQWRSIKEGKIKVAVGARSAIFAPFKNLGIVVVDEEHEPSYKSEVTPKYHAIEAGRMRCKITNAMLVLGSATPSVETYYRAQRGEIKLLKLLERPQKALLPQVFMVDLRKELEEGNRGMFSRLLRVEMEKNVHEEEQTMLFINRRGFSSFLLCRGCGAGIQCKHCNISMTYHLNGSRLICHYCGYTIPVPKSCPKCGSHSIRDFGVGTQKVEQEVVDQFRTSVIRMDMDTTSFKNGYETILNKFREENINIMIGTQMIAKGHDFPNVTLVGVLAADAILHAGDFRATERTFQLITQVAGRAGRGDKRGRVVVQSYNMDHYSILCATKHDYEAFYQNEIIMRERLGYPPFENIGTMLITGEEDQKTYNRAMRVYEACFIKAKELECVGDEEKSIHISKPLRASISRVKDKFRWRIVLKCAHREMLIGLFAKVSDDFYANNKPNSEDLSVDINPMNMI